MRTEKLVELNCDYCNEVVFKEAKEYKRRLKSGKTKFFCNLSCAAKSNESLIKNAKFSKNNPQEIKIRLAKFRKENPNVDITIRDEYTPFRRYLKKIKQRIGSKLKKNKELECFTLS